MIKAISFLLFAACASVPGADAASATLKYCYYSDAGCSTADDTTCTLMSTSVRASLVSSYPDVSVGSCSGGCFEASDIDGVCGDFSALEACRSSGQDGYTNVECSDNLAGIIAGIIIG